MSFHIEVPAKWVLSGEHSVMRGKSAIAFPYTSFSLKLKYTNNSDSELTITANPFHSQIKTLVQRGLLWILEKNHLIQVPTLTGEIEIESNIPIGSGLGSSAALCAAVARLILWKCESVCTFNQEIWIQLATHLEDQFHGKSSGMDVAAIIHAQGIEYALATRVKLLSTETLVPHFKLYDSGERGQTRECIQIVKEWQARHPEKIAEIDEQMQTATSLAKHALENYTSANSNECDIELAKAMNLAQNCFEAWGLVSPEMMIQKNELLKQGALAVKLTGAGLGGFWVALWPSIAPQLG